MTQHIIKAITLFSLVLVLNLSYAQNEGIAFEHGTWTEALAKAKSEDKLVFVDAYATWCGPCKWMAANSFTDPGVAESFNEKFVNYKMDMEKGEGPEIAKKYGVRAYPTLLFVDGSGQLMHQHVGALDAQGLIELGNEAADPSKQISAMVRKFEEGERSKDFLYDYMFAAQGANMDFSAPLEAYLEDVGPADMLEDKNWEVFKTFFWKTDSETFNYILNYRKNFDEKFGAEEVNGKLISCFDRQLSRAVYKEDEAAYNDQRGRLIASGLPDHTKVLVYHEMNWAKKQENWDAYARSADGYIRTLGSEVDPGTLNNIAWGFYENVDSKKHLKKAAKWAKKSVDMDPGYYNMDTYAMVLMKLGKTKDAMVAAQEAITKAKEDGEDYSATAEALKKMQQK